MGNACFTPSGQSAELEHDQSKDKGKGKKQMAGSTGEDRKFTVTAKTIKKEEDHHRQPSQDSMHTVDLHANDQLKEPVKIPNPNLSPQAHHQAEKPPKTNDPYF